MTATVRHAPLLACRSSTPRGNGNNRTGMNVVDVLNWRGLTSLGITGGGYLLSRPCPTAEGRLVAVW
jgi:hypothetical protein